ncbi:protein-disulfide reductase DsbD family protein [Fulvivirgaceae bacterium BMA12]|uniref:Protein-disulfide reductase DsbD family protein n=1 Tax=Agaribacillus aureus TaxID=3051825 RepID=A0ABT8LHR8_9BACT|nr:protein-disulfide reductase DsbD family protein [Fulvivirgaceae bacterium BMA12]
MHFINNSPMFGAFIIVIQYLLSFGVGAQIIQQPESNPHAKWTYTVSKIDDKTAKVQINLAVEPSWHVYSSDQDPDVGPKPTSIEFVPNDSFQLKGTLEASGYSQKYDPFWPGEVKYFEKSGKFVQEIKILSENPKIECKISYSVCSDANGLCFFPEESYDLSPYFRQLTDQRPAAGQNYGQSGGPSPGNDGGN